MQLNHIQYKFYMKNEKSLFIFIGLMTNLTICFSQFPTDETLVFRQASEEIFVLNNEFQNIPLVSIQSKDIGLISFNEMSLVEPIEKYFKVDKVIFSKEINTNDLRSWMNQKKHLIIPIDIGKNDQLEREKLLTFLKSDLKILNKTILVLFSKNTIPNLRQDHDDFPTIILAKRVNKLTSSLVAQSIFGALPLYNINGEKLTDGDLRLGYSTPEMVGMNSVFLHSKIDSIATNAINEKAFPGVQILVAKSGKVVFHEAYGFHTYEKVKPVQLNDIYDFASVSKITTALPALMKLHGEQKFDIDQPFQVYFPKFNKSNKALLTYREILAHQAGLKPWIPYWKNTIKDDGKFKRKTFKNRYTKRYNVSISDNLFLHRKYKYKMYKAIYESEVSPEKKYKYSGLAFYLFPEVVSDLTNSDFETHLKQTFYKPIGANTLTYNPLRYFTKDRIVPTELDTFFRNTQIHGRVHDEGAIMMGGVSSNAGLFGSANDLVKLMQMYLNGGTYGGQRFIAEESINEFTKYQYPENDNRRGLGFDKPLLEYHPQKSSVAKDASPSSYGHSGYTGTFVWVDPEHELIYIFFSNRVFPTRNNRKIYDLNIRPSIHQVIYDAIKIGN